MVRSVTIMDSSPFKEIERILERMGRQVEADLPVGMQRGMAVDVADYGDRYEVTMDLPGFEKEDIELMLTDRTLHIEAERHLEREMQSGMEGMAGEMGETAMGDEEMTEEDASEEAGEMREETEKPTIRIGEPSQPGVTYIHKERRRKSVSRSIDLPDPVDEEGVEASLSNGVLTVTLPKISPEEDAQHIDID